MASLEEFAARVGKAARGLPNRINRVVINVSDEAAKQLVFSTPVRTGRARGGWIGAINGEAIGPTPLDKSGSRTYSRLRQEISRKKAEEAIFISNNVPYIVALDMGSSRQAPQGMTPQALTVLRLGIRNATFRVLDD